MFKNILRDSKLAATKYKSNYYTLKILLTSSVPFPFKLFAQIEDFENYTKTKFFLFRAVNNLKPSLFHFYRLFSCICFKCEITVNCITIKKIIMFSLPLGERFVSNYDEIIKKHSSVKLKILSN